MKKIITPREPMVQKILKWCEKNGCGDISTYGTDGSRHEIDYRTKNLVSFEDQPFHLRIDGGKELLDSLNSSLKADASKVVGISAEGALNHALHYGTDYRLTDRFTKFLDRYGYKWHCISNCYYLVYKV